VGTPKLQCNKDADFPKNLSEIEEFPEDMQLEEFLASENLKTGYFSGL